MKRARTDNGNFSNARSDGQGRLKFRQRFPNQGFSSVPLRVNIIWCLTLNVMEVIVVDLMWIGLFVKSVE